MNVLFSERLFNASYWWNVGGNFSFGYLDAIYYNILTVDYMILFVLINNYCIKRIYINSE
jgi:hypothetical protein